MSRVSRIDTYKLSWWGILKEREHMQDTGIDDRVIMIYILKDMWWEHVGWINLAQVWTNGGLL
jgi:hypothetical protein